MKKKNLIKRARELRKNMTKAERILWQHVRRKNLGVKFRRQVPIMNYIVDFVCLEKKLIFEIDGGQHASREKYDRKREKELEMMGFKVLRFWNNEVIENIEGVINVTRKELEER